MIDQMSGPECVQIQELHRICMARKETQQCRARMPLYDQLEAKTVSEG